MCLIRFCLALVLLYATDVGSEDCGGVMGPEHDPRVYGVPGKRGEAGVVDYNKVEEMIRAKENQDLSQLRNEMKEKVDALEERVDAKIKEALESDTSAGNGISATDLINIKKEVEEVCDKKIDDLSRKFNRELENIRNTMDGGKVEPKVKAREVCKVRHRGICYWAMRQDGWASYKYFEEKCTSVGGSPVDIPSTTLYKKLKEYIRKEVIPSGEQYELFWTGMTFDPTADVVFLSNGNGRGFAEWYPDHPTTKEKSWNRVATNINTDPASEWQGMMTVDPTSSEKGIICQIKM